MSRRPATFTKSDLTRAMAVAREHGMTVEVQADGVIRLVPIPQRGDTDPVPSRLWVT